MGQYQLKNPVVAEAVSVAAVLDGYRNNPGTLPQWVQDAYKSGVIRALSEKGLSIQTLGGRVQAYPSQMIVNDGGTVYLRDISSFEAIWEPVVPVATEEIGTTKGLVADGCTKAPTLGEVLMDSRPTSAAPSGVKRIDDEVRRQLAGIADALLSILLPSDQDLRAKKLQERDYLLRDLAEIRHDVTRFLNPNRHKA